MNFLGIANKLDVDVLTKVFVKAVKTGKEIRNALSDGVDVMDGLVIFKEAEDIEFVYKNARTAWAQFRDMTTDEADQVRAAVAAELDDTDDVDGKILKTLKLITKTYRHAEATFHLFNDWKDTFRSF